MNKEAEQNEIVFGDQFLVKKIMSKETVMSKEEKFTNVVEILAIGHDIPSDFPISIGDKIIVSGTRDFEGDVYVTVRQLMRKVKSKF